MLKKLLKHEWAETWKIPTLALTGILLLSFVSALYFYLSPALAPDVEMNLGNMILYILYTFFNAVISLLITIYLGIRFFKNLYTDQGYLMHTLPVEPRMLIASKVCIGTFWIYAAGLVCTFAIAPVTALALPKIAYIGPDELALLLSAFSGIFGKSVSALLFFFVPYTLVSSVFSVLLLYASISLGQLFGKHKALSSIICYLGLNALISSLSAVFMVPGMTGIVITHVNDAEDFLSLTMPSIMHTAYFISFAVSAAFSVVFFWLCSYLIQKNLNLD